MLLYRAVAASRSPYRGQTRSGFSGRSEVTARSRRDKQDLRQRTNKRASPSARKPSPKTTDKLSDNEVGRFNKKKGEIWPSG